MCYKFLLQVIMTHEKVIGILQEKKSNNFKEFQEVALQMCKHLSYFPAMTMLGET